jgi:hypothetical protein
MAYKQEPGGGPKMKTGAGIPSVLRSKRNFGSYQVSSNESMGGSFEYTPGKRVKKLSSDSKSTNK